MGAMNIGVIFAGGSGQRMHSKDRPKQFLELYHKPIIIHTLEHFEACPDIDAVVIACIEGWIPFLEKQVAAYNIRKVKKIVPGGKTGQLSIYNGLKAAQEVANGEKSIVLIHDGVRPMIHPRLLSENIESVKQYGSAITTGVVHETIAVIDENRLVKHIPERAFSRVAKAPQSFWLDEILAVHEKTMAGGEYNAIDSCTLMRQNGKTLHVIDGPVENIKITTPEDYFLMRAILEAKENQQLYE